jgi:hypothetical protein
MHNRSLAGKCRITTDLWRENVELLTIQHSEWSDRLLAVSSCSSQELLQVMHPTQGVYTSPLPFTGSDPLYNGVLHVAIHREEIGVVRCVSIIKALIRATFLL